MSEPNYSKVVENYALLIIDGMDYKTMEQFVFDTLVSSLTQGYETVDELIEEIKEEYGEETLNTILNQWHPTSPRLNPNLEHKET